ncbi:hypothetical protein HYE68_005473 [Fusarium pseudograminearum]|nr:hypothetical protein HYE68_005473 [Fusarium pseudograminearum]
MAIMWLFIAWSFSWPAVFHDMTRQVLKHGQGLGYVKTYDLDVDGILGQYCLSSQTTFYIITDWLIITTEQLEKKRKILLDRLYKELVGIKQELSEGKLGCHHKCRSMMLGSLMLEKASHRDLPLEDQDDYSNLALFRFVTMVNNFRPIDWYTDHYNRPHLCNPKLSMQPVINEITKDLMVKLSDFQ